MVKTSEGSIALCQVSTKSGQVHPEPREGFRLTSFGTPDRRKFPTALLDRQLSIRSTPAREGRDLSFQSPAHVSSGAWLATTFTRFPFQHEPEPRAV
jgi:hypothetical protein